MNHICNTTRIDGPMESAFNLVTTSRHWPLWHPATEAVSGVTNRPLALGDQVHERASIGGRAHEGTWTVVEHTPSRLVLQIDGGATDPVGLESRMQAQSAEALPRLAWLLEQKLRLEDNKQVVRTLLERLFNQRDPAALEPGFTADAAIHDPGMDFRGPSELRGGLETLLAAFPDFHFTVLDALAEDDRVVIRYRGQGTHGAEFLGMPATGRRIDYTGLLLVRLEGQAIAKFWAQPDQLGNFTQLGLHVQPVG